MVRSLSKILIGLILLIGTSAYAADQNSTTWNDSSNNETGFKLERTTATDVASCQSASGWTQIVVTPANAVGFVDSAVNQGTVYCYRVRAFNTAGDSAYSNIAGRLVPFTIPAAPTNLQVGP